MRVEELERMLMVGSGGGGGGGWGGDGGKAGAQAVAEALPAVLHNMHDFFIHVAAQVLAGRHLLSRFFCEVPPIDRVLICYAQVLMGRNYVSKFFCQVVFISSMESPVWGTIWEEKREGVGGKKR